MSAVEGAGDVEHLDAVIVGAGLSGIDAAHHLHRSCPWAEVAILESRGAIGGTWDLFRYPGIRSDSDMYTYSYPFRPWTDERAIGDGEAIRRYLVETAREEGVDRLIRFHHRVVRADWSSEESRWRLTVERSDPDDGPVETVELTCGFLIACTGYYRYDRGYLPDFEGMADFGGVIVHPQHWPGDIDLSGSRVVVIGSGATAITLVPELAAVADHVTMLQRSPTYLISRPTRGGGYRLVRRLVPRRHQATALRWLHALVTQGFYRLSRRRPELVKRLLRRGLERELPPGYDLDTHFTPHYDPWDQRLCVVTDGDLFAAIRDGRASVVTDRIERFTADGLRLASGRELGADVIVTATGLDLLFLGGIELTVDGEKVDPATRLTYKGMMLSDVPNLAFVVGYANASWTLKSDLTCEYVARLLSHLHHRGLSCCVPRAEGVEPVEEGLLPLSSGYIARAADRMPLQGGAFPWRTSQSYVADYRALHRGEVDDGVLEFSGTAPADG